MKTKTYKEFCWYNDGSYYSLDIDPEQATKKELIARATSYLKSLGFSKQDIEEELAHCYIISYSNNITEEKMKKQTKQPVMEIPITEEELQELMHGKTFKWTFDGIDVKLFKEKE